MHGPYSARVRVTGKDVTPFGFSLFASDVREGGAIAHKFYEDGGVATLVGFTRAAVFTVGALLSPGESAEVEIVGYEGSGSQEREQVAKFERVNREYRESIVTTLGSRFNERIFRGV